MAKGRKTGGRNFQPGHKFGRGRPQLSADFKAAKLFTKDEIRNVISKYLDQTIEQLQALEAEKLSMRAIDLIVIKFIFDALKGDHYKAEWLIARTIGRVSDGSEKDNDEKQTAHDQLIQYLKAKQIDDTTVS